MCRFVAYVGQPITLESLIFLPRNSLINQSINAEEFEERLNGDGFGIGWYAPSVAAEPAVFRSVTPAWSNKNLMRLARVVESETILAHVRAASPGMQVLETNCHPFSWGRYCFMHNGHIGDFAKLRRPLRRELSDEAYDMIEGSTDSEHLFALFVANLGKYSELQRGDAMARALEDAVRSVVALQKQHGTGDVSYLNVSVTDGVRLVAIKFTDGPAEHALSLYVRKGRQYICENGVCRMMDSGHGKSSVMVCSEKLSDDAGWEAVPVNHIVLVDEERAVETRPLEVGV